MPTKRQFISSLAGAVAGCVVPRGTRAGTDPAQLQDAIGRIEAEVAGRLGVAVLETGSRMRAGHRADERFPLCSTFKLLAAGAVLQRVDKGQERLERRIRFSQADIVVYSPVTKDRAGGDGMTVGELCEAALTLSDNTAGNLILASLGGPQGLNAFARAIGDATTRLDRNEPTLNEAVPGDPRDTTTPNAMLKNVETLALGNTLSAGSRQQLLSWLQGNRTGDTRLRAGLPKTWRCGDKTGSGERGTTNDVGIVWPAAGAPILVAIYLTETSASPERRNAALADVGRALAGGMRP